MFFTTSDPLVVQDINGVQDVYEYDVSTKHVSLLSPGTGAAGSCLPKLIRTGRTSSSRQASHFFRRTPIRSWISTTCGSLADSPNPPPNSAASGMNVKEPQARCRALEPLTE